MNYWSVLDVWLTQPTCDVVWNSPITVMFFKQLTVAIL